MQQLHRVSSSILLLSADCAECHSWVRYQATSSRLDTERSRCKSEFRICGQGYEFDSEFDGPQGFFGLWHSACDAVLTYVPTTPAITSLSMTADLANCQSAQSYCSVFGASTDSCSESSINELQSCICQATVLDLASRCEIDGSILCGFLTPTSTNLFSYKSCSGSAASAASRPSITSSRVVGTSRGSASTSNIQPSSNPTATIASPTNSQSSSAKSMSRSSYLSSGIAGLLTIYFSLS
jgi:hypothetical protein